MKSTKIIFWVLKIIMTLFFLNASIMELTKNENSIGVYQLLQFPLYLMPFIAVSRIIALLVIWIPSFKRLKEWAFAGLVIDVIGAGYCLYMATSDISIILFPALSMIVILLVYFFYHKINHTGLEL